MFSDTQTTAIYFFWFSLSLALWSAQGLYARAFYAAGDTLTPMAAVTIITAATLPIYSFLFHRLGVVGLAYASDIGIGAIYYSGLALALSKARPPGRPALGRISQGWLTAVIAGGVSFEVAKDVPFSITGLGSRVADLLRLGLISVTWAAAVAAGLWLLRSQLPADLRRRKGAVYPAVAQGEGKEILGAGTQP